VYQEKINNYRLEGWDIYKDRKQSVYIENKNTLENYVIDNKNMNFLLEKFDEISKKFFLSDVDKNDYVMMAVLDEVKDEQKKALKENVETNFQPGDKATISINSGVDSEKEVTIASWDEIKFDGRGIPVNVQGAYYQPNRQEEIPFRYADGKMGIISKDRLIKLGHKPNIRFENKKTNK